MNLTEVRAVVRVIQANCPAQAIDDYTAEAWHLSLADVPFEDAILAAGRLCKTRSWVGTRDICEEVDRIREKRIDNARVTYARTGDPDDPELANMELRQILKMAADGRFEEKRLALTVGDAPRPADSAAYRAYRATLSGHDEEFMAMREQANTARCRRCKAPVGRPCVGPDGSALAKSPAHLERLEDTGQYVAASTRSRDEVLAELAKLAQTETPMGETPMGETANGGAE